MTNSTGPDGMPQGPVEQDPARHDQGSHSALPFREDRDGTTQWNADFEAIASERDAATDDRANLVRSIGKAAFVLVILAFIGGTWVFISRRRAEISADVAGSSDVSGGGLLDSLPFTPMGLVFGLLIVVIVLTPVVTALRRILTR